MADPEKTAAPAPYTPPSQLDPAELSKMLAEEGVIEKPVEEAKPAVEAPKPAEPEKPSEPELLRRARENAEKRKAAEASKPFDEAARNFTPQQLLALSRAAASQDPVAALAALGFSHAQYTQKMLGVAPPEKTTEEVAPKNVSTVPPEVETLRQKIERLEAEREAERLAASRQQAFSQMEAVLKDDPKFKYINSLKDFEGVEKVLIQYHQQTGELPGKDLAESIKLAAEVYEADLQKQAERFLKVQSPLTPAPASAPLQAQKAPESQPSTGTVTPRTLTNSNTSAPAEVRTVPMSKQEVLDAIARGEDIPEGRY